jgi:anhydro-N-acetylmuramic acid kinase
MKFNPQLFMTGEKHSVIGQMSGTSLDGMDLGLFHFWEHSGQWKFEIAVAETIPYPTFWKAELETALQKSTDELLALDREYGKWVGHQIKLFINRHQVNTSLAGCHGHTVWHQPERGFTLQLGHGGAIAMHSEIVVVNDFRSQDVALGGQGAPLVPIGDTLLFPQLDWCLNIGGIANITDKRKAQAFDICPANMLFNHFAKKLGKEYDPEGSLARGGKIIPELLRAWMALPYFDAPAPKSLGREWVEANILTTDLDAFEVADLLRTSLEMCALLIGKYLHDLGTKGIVTGGGAHNAFLMERISHHCGFEIQVANRQIIDFKEALIFAFMGLLRYLNRENVLCQYTGASRNHSAGAIWHP